MRPLTKSGGVLGGHNQAIHSRSCAHVAARFDHADNFVGIAAGNLNHPHALAVRGSLVQAKNIVVGVARRYRRISEMLSTSPYRLRR